MWSQKSVRGMGPTYILELCWGQVRFKLEASNLSLLSPRDLIWLHWPCSSWIEWMFLRAWGGQMEWGTQSDCSAFLIWNWTWEMLTCQKDKNVGALPGAAGLSDAFSVDAGAPCILSRTLHSPFHTGMPWNCLGKTKPLIPELTPTPWGSDLIDVWGGTLMFRKPHSLPGTSGTDNPIF